MSTTQRIVFLYRDADNYKFALTRTVQSDQPLSVGDEVEYERISFDQQTFHREVVGYAYDYTSDHNLLEVVEATLSDAEPDCVLTPLL